MEPGFAFETGLVGLQSVSSNCCELPVSFWELLIENEVFALTELSISRLLNSSMHPSLETGLTSINDIHLFGVSFIKARRTPITGSCLVQELSNADSVVLLLGDAFKSQSGSMHSWLPVVLEEIFGGCSNDATDELLLEMPAVAIGVSVCWFSLLQHSFLAPMSQGSYSLCLF